jgi:protein-disulfide isomerase
MSKRSAAQERAERAAAALVEQRRKERRRTFLSVVGVVVAMAVIVAGGALIAKKNGSGPSDAASAPDSSVASVTIGSANAAHSVVIYEDFLCPFCGELEKRTHTQLATAADAGKVTVTYRPFNLLDTDYSQQSLEVFAAVQHTAGAEVAKKLHDALYADQPEESGPYPSLGDIVATAVTAGADKAAVQKALDDGDAQKWAEASTKAAQDAHVQSTPTVLLDGDEVSGRTVDDIASNLLKAVS